jgi:hypothetical protein
MLGSDARVTGGGFRSPVSASDSDRRGGWLRRSLFVGAFSRALGRASNPWKYKLQVFDSSMRRESRHFKTSLSPRAPAQSLCTSGPHDTRRMLPIFAGELPTVTGAVGCVTGFSALEVSLRACIAAIVFPHDGDDSVVWRRAARRHKIAARPHHKRRGICRRQPLQESDCWSAQQPQTRQKALL